MQLIYNNHSVEKFFSDYAKMGRKIGPELTRGVKKIVDWLNASDNIGIFLKTNLGKPHTLAGDLNGMYGVHISANFRVVFKPNIESDDITDILNCEKIVMIGVMDYHGTKYNWIIP